MSAYVLTSEKKEPGSCEQHDTSCDERPFAGTVGAWRRDLAEPGGIPERLAPLYFFILLITLILASFIHFYSFSIIFEPS